MLALLAALASSATYAVLVSGSNTYKNYRHQADVFQLTKILEQRGIKPADIVIMAYNDIVHHLRNPFKGKVFNMNEEEDVFPDKHTHHFIEGENVTVEAFYDVLQGKTGPLKLTKQDNILGKSMIDILRRRNDDHSWPDMIQNISDCLAGRASPQFSMKVSADVINGGTVHLYCNVICMNATQVTLEGEHTLIEKVAIIFDDCTESVSRQEILDEEQRRINVMLLRVLPEKVLYRLEDGTRERRGYCVRLIHSNDRADPCCHQEVLGLRCYNAFRLVREDFL